MFSLGRLSIPSVRLYITKVLFARYLESCPMNFDQTWQAHITINALCVTTTQLLTVEVTRDPKLGLSTWWSM